MKLAAQVIVTAVVFALGVVAVAIAALIKAVMEMPLPND